MTTRIATIEDIDKINSLVNSAYRGESSKLGWTTEADLLGGVRTTEASLAQMIKQENSVILLAEKNAVAQACVYLQQQGNVLYLGMLTVSPALQGQGIGALLMEAAEQRARALVCELIRMTVITVRAELIAYYQRKGFVDTGKREAFPDDPEFLQKQPLEFMIMEKRLTGA